MRPGKIKKMIRRIRAQAEELKSYPDKKLLELSNSYKKRIQYGESPDSLLTEAYALVCEADRRILGKNPYDVQIYGAIALHYGYLAQMNTGEGKTLVATMPLYLNALTGKSTILVTTNEYLAIRDAEEMGQVYRFLGMTVGIGVKKERDENFSNEEKKQIYASDIVYTTNYALGFDYLFHNLATVREERFLRPFYFVILDEADSVLLDSAQTPLIIAGSPRVRSNLYGTADYFISTLQSGRDYEQEETRVWLTEEGIRRAETFFGITNLYSAQNFEINRHVTLALRAHTLFTKEKDYMVTEGGELVLLDADSGRSMPGVKIRGGQHQAIEVKEKKEISEETRSVASITYQNLFRMVPRLAGMSGTISDAAQELLQTYGRRLMIIPPNRPVQRVDHRDCYYRTAKEEREEAMKEVLHHHGNHRPVLIVVSTIAETNMVSEMLVKEKIPHSVLNANNAAWEANIIAEAGKRDAVTVATSMAGRGTDIKLGEGIDAMGGLAVVGIGRMADLRLERQARGRAGRQGDPGRSRFFVSLEDEVVVRNADEKQRMRGMHRSVAAIQKIIDGAQKNAEEHAESARQSAFEYDLVMQKQREQIYALRDRLLDGGKIEKDAILSMARRVIGRFLHSDEYLGRNERRSEQKKNRDIRLKRFVLDTISYYDFELLEGINPANKKMLGDRLFGMVKRALLRQRRKFESEKEYDDFLLYAVLSAIDEAWVEQADYLQQLSAAVRTRSSAQRNPVYEYQKDALDAFENMQKRMEENALRNILLSGEKRDASGKMQIVLP